GQGIERPLFFGEGCRLSQSRHKITGSPAARTQEAFASPKRGRRHEIAPNDQLVRPAAIPVFQHRRWHTIPEAKLSRVRLPPRARMCDLTRCRFPIEFA